jgi:hypothetical protein
MHKIPVLILTNIRPMENPAGYPVHAGYRRYRMPGQIFNSTQKHEINKHIICTEDFLLSEVPVIKYR